MGGECAGSRASTVRGVERGPLAGAARPGVWSGGRAGREGRVSGPRGLELAGLGYPGHPPSPAQPASAYPCQALLYHRPRVTAVGAASRARPLRSSESTRMDEIFENQITNRSY